jgi:hypothetical protein
VAAAWEDARGEPVSEDADANMGAAIAAAVRTEADAIATEAMVGLTRLVEHGVALLPQPADRPLEVVTIGASGPLPASAPPSHARARRRDPLRKGARIGGAPGSSRHRMCPPRHPDGAIGWLFRGRTIDAVLVGADWIAANGDVANVTGTFPLAVMAARHDVPVYVCAPRLVVSERKTTGNALTIIMRGRQELLATPAEPTAEGIDVRVPLSDVTPAELVTAYVTDVGVLRAPFALPAALLGAPGDATSSGEPAAPSDGRPRVGRASTASTCRSGRSAIGPAAQFLGATPLRRGRHLRPRRPGVPPHALGRRLRWRRLVAWPWVRHCPQPLFVMGEPDGVTAILRTVIRPRAAYVASLSSQLPAVERVYRLGASPPMVRMWVDRTSFRPQPGGVFRILPSEIGDLNRLYNLGFTAWLSSDAVANGIYYGIRIGGRLAAAAGTHVIP